MYSTEAPMAIRLPDPSCAPHLPTRVATLPADGEKEVVIRAAQASEPVRCDSCRSLFLSAGPTAYADDAPLCDRCVFEHDAQLAMVLAAVSVLRAFGSEAPSPADQQAALDLLGFARLYETFAAQHGPRREPEMP
jgi:hypothetical protein